MGGKLSGGEGFMMVLFSSHISVISDCCGCFISLISLEFMEQELFWITCREVSSIPLLSCFLVTKVRMAV